MENILDQLNDAQRAAVVWLDGPQLVIAGAGSGKTRVLTYKIAYLVSRGVAPWRILALTVLPFREAVTSVFGSVVTRI